jgi:cytochrome c biogenesis protein CcmG, thiol:disulfide interchange protein DsbE
MAQKLAKEKQEQELARIQRQELKVELADNYAQLPRRPRNRSRIITFSVFGVIALFAGVFGWLILLPSPSQQPMTGVAIGAAAPEFKLPIYGGGDVGGSIDIRALHGHAVILNFWSESCPPCLTEIPYLERTYTQFRAQGQFMLLGVNQADPKDDIARFGANFNITYPLLFDKGGATNADYGVTAIPTTYFIDNNGIVRSVFVQPLTPETMRQGLSSVGIGIS